MSTQQLSVIGYRLEGDGHALVVAGELDLATAPQLLEAVRAALAESAGSITLDLGDLTFMDSSGMQCLLEVGELCRRQRCELRLTPVRPQIQRVFSLIGGTERSFRLPGTRITPEAYASKRRRFHEGVIGDYLHTLHAPPSGV